MVLREERLLAPPPARVSAARRVVTVDGGGVSLDDRGGRDRIERSPAARSTAAEAAPRPCVRPRPERAAIQLQQLVRAVALHALHLPRDLAL